MGFFTFCEFGTLTAEVAGHRWTTLKTIYSSDHCRGWWHLALHSRSYLFPAGTVQWLESAMRRKDCDHSTQLVLKKTPWENYFLCWFCSLLLISVGARYAIINPSVVWFPLKSGKYASAHRYYLFWVMVLNHKITKNVKQTLRILHWDKNTGKTNLILILELSLYYKLMWHKKEQFYLVRKLCVGEVE